MEILVTILYIIACVLMFALAILVHEFGHFIVALKLGLKVEAFSIGFGPALWKKTVNGVEYRISALPLGGYVSIPDVDPEGTKALEGAKEAAKGDGEQSAASRRNIPAWKELLVAVAGPAMNIVLAVVLALLLACVPSANFRETRLEVVGTAEGSPAQAVGILAGDTIVAINGNGVRNRSDMLTEFLLAKGRASEITLVRGGTNVVVHAEPRYEDVGGSVELPILGVMLPASGKTLPWMTVRNPAKQLAYDAGSIFRILKGLTTPKEVKATSSALGGPVSIAGAIYTSMRNNVWDGVGFLRFLNVNLAVLNLLPIPVLDGGLILFALIALVFRRRVPEAVVKYASLFFMALLMLAMGFLILRDSYRLYGMRRHAVQAAAQVSTTNTTEAVNGTSDARD